MRTAVAVEPDDSSIFCEISLSVKINPSTQARAKSRFLKKFESLFWDLKTVNF